MTERPFDAYLDVPRHLPPFGVAQLCLSGQADTAEQAWDISARHWLSGGHRGQMRMVFDGHEVVEGSIGYE